MKALSVFLLLTMLVIVPVFYGQSTFGSIVGVTQDATLAVIPEVNVTIRNLDENVSRTAVSGPDGSFQFLNLKPGHYEITALKSEFVDFKIADRLLEARQALRIAVKLEIAGIGTELAVTTDLAPAINTENGVVSDTKDFRQVTQLPVNYRGGSTSALAAINTVPSVQQDSSGNVSIGGGTPAMIQYSVDGVSTVNVRANGALGDLNPSSEMISEFKVTASNNNAEFSQVGDVTISTKSGSNQFHGSLFEYSQNRLLDATVYGFDSKPKKVFNTFGGSLSGPLARDRTFFFADYEGNRRRFSTPEQLSAPTEDMRNGVLDGLSGPIVDPQTGLPFPNNRIPVNRISPVSRILLNNYYPLPNAGAGTALDTNANLRELVPAPADTNGYDVRIDHNLSTRQQIYARWSWKNVTSTVPNGLLPSELDREGNRNLIVSHNIAVSPSMLNEFRFGISRVSTRVGFPIQGAAAIAQLGLQGLDLSDVPNVNAFPVFNFTDGTGFTTIGRDKTGLTFPRRRRSANRRARKPPKTPETEPARSPCVSSSNGQTFKRAPRTGALYGGNHMINGMTDGQLDPFVERMLDVTARRQEAISSNLANIDTPGYKAKGVSFHDELDASLQLTSTNPAHITSSSPTSPLEFVEVEGTMKPSGNNVDLEHEMTEMNKNGMEYIMLVQNLSSTVKGLRYAISEGTKG